MKERVKEAFALNNAMHEDVAKFLKENGGLVCTENVGCDTIYAFIYDECYGEYREYPVLAVALFEKSQVCVLIDTGQTTIEGLTDEEVLDCDEWYSVMGGLVLINATLLNICESIEQYVEQKKG